MPYKDLTQHEKRALLVNTCLTSSLIAMVENLSEGDAEEVIAETMQHITKFISTCSDRQVDKAMKLLQESIDENRQEEIIILDLSSEVNNASNN